MMPGASPLAMTRPAERGRRKDHVGRGKSDNVKRRSGVSAQRDQNQCAANNAVARCAGIQRTRARRRGMTSGRSSDGAWGGRGDDMLREQRPQPPRATERSDGSAPELQISKKENIPAPPRKYVIAPMNPARPGAGRSRPAIA